LAGRKVKPEYSSPTPQVHQSVELNQKRVVNLQALVEMKLNSFRRKDQVHLLDLIQTGLVDETWPSRFPDDLGTRLQSLLDDPDG
jgi:hypothetical protein